MGDCHDALRPSWAGLYTVGHLRGYAFAGRSSCSSLPHYLDVISGPQHEPCGVELAS